MKKLLIVALGSLMFGGCCGVYSPTCATPCSIYNVSPARVSGAPRPYISRSWSCADSYTCAEYSTVHRYR